MWASLGRELATLHSMPLPKGTGGNAPMRYLRPWPTRTWKKSGPSGHPCYRSLPIDSRRVELEDQVGALPPVFIHGDCHTDNIVHSAGSLVFCDWQAAGIGRAVSDLAFLSVRVTPAGVTVPRAPGRHLPGSSAGRAPRAAACAAGGRARHPRLPVAAVRRVQQPAGNRPRPPQSARTHGAVVRRHSPTKRPLETRAAHPYLPRSARRLCSQICWRTSPASVDGACDFAAASASGCTRSHVAGCHTDGSQATS